MYASIADLRLAAPVSVKADDNRLARALVLATQIVDAVTGWFFEPRYMTKTVSGRGLAVVALPLPLLQLESVSVGTHVYGNGQVVVQGLPYLLLTLQGEVFPRGVDNVTIAGWWGCTETDGTALGRTPLEIQRATLLLAARMLSPVGESADKWRIVEERTRDQSYRLSPIDGGELTGDPEVDRILKRYTRPMAIGAA